MSDGRKHLTETGMAKGLDPELPGFTTEPAAPGSHDLQRPHDAPEPDDLEPAVQQDDLEQNRSTRPRED